MTLSAGLVIFGGHPYRVLDLPPVWREIDGSAAVRTRDRVVRLEPAKNFLEAITALRMTADEIEQPEIQETHAGRWYQRHA
jgi:hypothetical protein